MSGKADSKQISGPIRSVPPPGSGTVITTFWVPRRRSTAAALEKWEIHPRTGRSGMYSPKGTSRILS